MSERNVISILMVDFRRSLSLTWSSPTFPMAFQCQVFVIFPLRFLRGIHMLRDFWKSWLNFAEDTYTMMVPSFWSTRTILKSEENSLASSTRISWKWRSVYIYPTPRILLNLWVYYLSHVVCVCLFFKPFIYSMHILMLLWCS